MFLGLAKRLFTFGVGLTLWVITSPTAFAICHKNFDHAADKAVDVLERKFSPKQFSENSPEIINELKIIRTGMQNKEFSSRFLASVVSDLGVKVNFQLRQYHQDPKYAALLSKTPSEERNVAQLIYDELVLEAVQNPCADDRTFDVALQLLKDLMSSNIQMPRQFELFWAVISHPNLTPHSLSLEKHLGPLAQSGQEQFIQDDVRRAIWINEGAPWDIKKKSAAFDQMEARGLIRSGWLMATFAWAAARVEPRPAKRLKRLIPHLIELPRTWEVFGCALGSAYRSFSEAQSVLEKLLTSSRGDLENTGFALRAVGCALGSTLKPFQHEEYLLVLAVDQYLAHRKEPGFDVDVVRAFIRSLETKNGRKGQIPGLLRVLNQLSEVYNKTSDELKAYARDVSLLLNQQLLSVEEFESFLEGVIPRLTTRDMIDTLVRWMRDEKSYTVSSRIQRVIDARKAELPPS